MSKTTDAIKEMARPFAEQVGLFIWDVRLEKQGQDLILRVVLDGPRTVTLDDCELVSRGIDPLLDEADPIAEPYCLEVSSPGLGRRLYTEEHLRMMQGQQVTVALYKAIDGEKEFAGELAQTAEDGGVTLGEPCHMSFKKADIKFIKMNDDLNLFEEKRKK